MIKRIAAGVLCALMACALFTSCAKTDNTKESQGKMLTYSPDCAYSDYETGIVYAYNDFCGAVYNGEETFTLNPGFVQGVLTLFYTSCPLNALVESVDSNDDNTELVIKYKYGADEAKAKSAAFEEKVLVILDECKSGKVSNTAFILNVYKYVSTNVKPTDKDGVNAYEAIMNGKGDSYSASNMFEFLLRQGGVDSYHVLANDASGAGWGMSMAEIDGSKYLFDPMTEQYANGGKALCSFGMTTEDAGNAGLSNFIYSDRTQAAVCDNPFFDACRNSVSWEFGENGSNLLVTKNDGKIVEIAL